MTHTTDKEIHRTPRGRFAPGNSGNPAGGTKRLTAEQRIERCMNSHGVELLERAFVRAKDDDAVLANLLGFLASCQTGAARTSEAMLQAVSGSHH